jgi:adenylate kinase family enzyme
MTSIILIRGPAAIGKTTLARKLVTNLNAAAYFSEDNFRGWMQVKRGEVNPITYKNSGIILQSTIDKLLELDSYDYVIIEGLFPDNDVLNTYFKFAKKRSFDIFLFQLVANKKILIDRNKIERGHIVKESAIDDHIKLYEKLNKKAIVVSNEGSIDETFNYLMKCIKGKL